MTLDAVLARVDADLPAALTRVLDLLRIPSISTDPAFAAARQTLTEESGRPAAYIGCGGSIPIAGYFKTCLGRDAMLIGFGRDADQIHSPNEKYDVACFHKGIRSWVRVPDRLR